MKLFRRWGTNEPSPEAANTAASATEEPQAAPPEGDRGIPSVNRTRSVQSRVSSVLAVLLMSALGVGMLGWYYGRALSRSAQSQDRARAASRARAQGDMPLPPLGAFDRPPPPTGLTTPAAVESTHPDASFSHGPPGPRTKSAGELAFARRLRGPAFARLSGPNAAPAASAVPTTLETAETGGDARNEVLAANAASESGSLASLLQPTVTHAVRAQELPTRRLLLPKGAFIDCTLETAIDSTLPGMTTCITATDTFGADGNVVLFERGTKLVGETRGEVRRGGSRVFVVWNEARTPQGVVVPLASAGTDELGRSGLPGHVNRHFWERFGAAILVSVIDSAAQAAVQNGNGGGTVIYNPSRTTDVLTEILRGTINLPPTVVKNQGDRIQVLVARDVDFRSVYELHPVTGR
ncbi:MAG TPA: type IV secretion system protein VirB10 [Stellaceae bacterium]|nr:type IV secretion system protein VirB10 [Stellaceae bacterium]